MEFKHRHSNTNIINLFHVHIQNPFADAAYEYQYVCIEEIIGTGHARLSPIVYELFTIEVHFVDGGDRRISSDIIDSGGDIDLPASELCVRICFLFCAINQFELTS